MTCVHKPVFGPGIFSFSPKVELRVFLADADLRSYDYCGYYEALVCRLCGAVYIPKMITKWQPLAPPIPVRSDVIPTATLSRVQREQAMRARLAKTDMSNDARLRTLQKAVSVGVVLDREQQIELRRLLKAAHFARRRLRG